MERPLIPALGAPTASGKSAAALQLALERGNVELVTADAMQVYAGMDIGTAKPTAEERAAVPHHLLDIVTPDMPFSVQLWVEAAEEAIAAVLSRGNVPLVVGGTGFYLRALSMGLPLVPAADPGVQAPLWDRVSAGELPKLVAELTRLAPADAARADRNPRRVVRALEILQRTGRPPSEFGYSEPAFRVSKLVLLPEPAELDARIALRARQMFADGLVAEVSALLARWPGQLTAMQAIGYKEVLEHLRGEASLEEAMERVRVATVQYSRRQLTWFRKEPDARQLSGLAGQNMPALREWLSGF